MKNSRAHTHGIVEFAPTSLRVFYAIKQSELIRGVDLSQKRAHRFLAPAILVAALEVTRASDQTTLFSPMYTVKYLPESNEALREREMDGGTAIVRQGAMADGEKVTTTHTRARAFHAAAGRTEETRN